MTKISSKLSIPKPPPSFKSLDDVRVYLNDLVSGIYRDFDRLYREFNGGVGFENMRHSSISTSSGGADVEITISHNLGYIPTFYLSNCSAGYVYDSRRSEWTTTQMYLKCSADTASISLLVF